MSANAAEHFEVVVVKGSDGFLGCGGGKVFSFQALVPSLQRVVPEGHGKLFDAHVERKLIELADDVGKDKRPVVLADVWTAGADSVWKRRAIDVGDVERVVDSDVGHF